MTTSSKTNKMTHSDNITKKAEEIVRGSMDKSHLIYRISQALKEAKEEGFKEGRLSFIRQAEKITK